MCYKAIDLVENIAYRCANRTEKGEGKMVGASRLFIETGPHKPLVAGSNPAAATSMLLSPKRPGMTVSTIS